MILLPFVLMAIAVKADVVWSGDVNFANAGQITVGKENFANVYSRFEGGKDVYPYLVLRVASDVEVKLLVDFYNGGANGKRVTLDPAATDKYKGYFYTVRTPFQTFNCPAGMAVAWYRLDAELFNALKEGGLYITGGGDFTCKSIHLEWDTNAFLPNPEYNDIQFGSDDYWRKHFIPWDSSQANSEEGYRLGGMDGHFQVTQQYVSLNFTGDPRVMGTEQDRYIRMKKGDILRVFCPDRLPDLYLLKEVEVFTKNGCALKLVEGERGTLNTSNTSGQWKCAEEDYLEDIWFEAVEDVLVKGIKYTTIKASKSHAFDVCKIGGAKKATFCPNYDVIAPQGLTAYKATRVFKVNNKAYVEFSEIEADANGNVLIPNNEGIYLETDVPGDYKFNWCGYAGTKTLSKIEDNLLKGNNNPEYAPEDGDVYILASGPNGVGFYRNLEGGNLRRGVAYILCSEFDELKDGDGRVPEEQKYKAPEFVGITFDGDDTTGIQAVFETKKEISTETGIYTIDGRRVDNMKTPGLYIVNGKKYLKK